MWAESIVHDIRYAQRQLRRSPVSALTVIIILALGIGATTAMFSLVNAWLLRPLPLKDPQQLVIVWRTAAANPHEPAYFDLYHDYLAWASGNRTLQSLAATFWQPYTLTGAGEPQQVNGALATWNLFATVGAGAEIGRVFEADDVQGGPACVISHGLWQERFGSSRDVVGRSINLDGTPYRLLGVLPAKFSLRVLDQNADTSVWTLITASDPYHASTSATPVTAIGRLQPGITAAQAEAELNAMQRGLNRQFVDEPENSGVLVAGLQQDNTRTIRTSLLLLMAAVAVLLLIACVNAGSLILGRNSQRWLEFAVRLALGCRPSRLLQQLTTEVLLLFACGGALGCGVAYALLKFFVAVNPLDVLPPGGIAPDGRVLGTSAAVILVAALVFGSVPAMRALRRRDAEALRARAATAGRAHLRSRMAFVAVEIALTTVLLVTAGLLISSFVKLLATPLGFRTQGVFVGSLGLPLSRYSTVEAQSRFLDDLEARLRGLPSVQQVGYASTWTIQAMGLQPVEREGGPGSGDRVPQAYAFTTGPGYFGALGVPLLQGRDFRDTDRHGAPEVAIVNAALASAAFPGEDPVGKRLRVRSLSSREAPGPWLTIVGVVANTSSMRYNSTQWEQAPAIYRSFPQLPDVDKVHRFDRQQVYVFVQASDLNTPAFAAAVHALDPDLPVAPLRTTAAIVGDLRAQPRARAAGLAGFALLTLLLAVVGVYGVMTQLVEQRRREIGIRIALGAMSSAVLGLIVRRGLLLVGVGVAAGLAGAMAAARMLRGLLYGVSSYDPLTFAAVVVILSAVAMAASYFPARRAAGIDPSVTLRSE